MGIYRIGINKGPVCNREPTTTMETLCPTLFEWCVGKLCKPVWIRNCGKLFAEEKDMKCPSFSKQLAPNSRSLISSFEISMLGGGGGGN